MTKIHKKIFFHLSWVVVIAVILAAGVLVSFTRAYAGRSYPHLYLGKQSLGGKTSAELHAILEARAQAVEAGIVLKYEDKQFTLSPSEIRLKYDISGTEAAVIHYGRETNWLQNIAERLRVLFGREELDSSFTYDAPRLDVFLDKVAGEIEIPERDARLVYDETDSAWKVQEEQTGRVLEKSILKNQILETISMMEGDPLIIRTNSVKPQISKTEAERMKGQADAFVAESLILTFQQEKFEISRAQLADWLELAASAKDGFSPTLTLRVNQEKVKAFLATLATQINQDPIDAILKFDGGKASVFQASQPGYKLDEDKALASINTAVSGGGSRSFELAVNVTQPVVTTETVNNLGIKELLARGTTSFKGSPDNRRHNISNGVKALNGQLLKPGAEFSVVTTLGAVDDTTGYLPELVIKENRTTPEFGGGLCQVSTTLFRTILAAGLRVTERQNHSYRVSYYEPPVGLDATVYLPKPDLRFVNDTPGYILIQGYIEGNNVIFEFYGTKDGRVSKIDGPYVSDITDPPAPIYADTDTLPVGTTKQLEKAHQGATAVAYYTVTKDGKELFKQTFRSLYKPWPARFLVGTAASATPAQPASTPSETPVPTPTPSLSPTESTSP